MQATFFTTYILSSGWASLAVEVMQIFPLLCNLFQRFILRLKEDARDGSLSFPYHTEVPRILLFGFLGFTCAILAPLMLPFLLIYFFIAYLVYRNQVSKSIRYLSCIFPNVWNSINDVLTVSCFAFIGMMLCHHLTDIQ